MNTDIKTGLDAAKTASKKVFHKTAEVTGEMIGNKILKKKNSGKIVKPKPLPAENSKNVVEINIPPEKREEILNELKQVL